MAFTRLPGWFALAAVAGLAWACSSKQTTDTTSSSGGGSTSSTAVSSSTASTGGAGPSTSASTSSAGGTGGSAMIACPKAGYTTVKGGECDLLQQNCPAGDTCGPIQSAGSWTTKCYPASGLKGIKKACTADAECEAGLFCVFDTCTPVCCPGNNEPCAGGICNVSLELDNANYDMACSFSQSCVLLMKSDCPMGQDCHIEDPMQGLATCTPPSGSQVDEGGACMYINDCHDNQYCYGTGPGAGVCRWHCDTTDMKMDPPGLGGCPAGETCQMPQTFGVPNLGLCLP